MQVELAFIQEKSKNMPYCCVPRCTNYSQRNGDVSYHRISKDIGIRNAWIARLRRDNLDPECSRVSSVHFTEDCFEDEDHAKHVTGEKGEKS